MIDRELITRILDRTKESLSRVRRFPIATYRLQFHAGFTFRQAKDLVPYLEALGIADCYGSPYLKARPGSKHGYDIVDHRHLNPEIGTEEEYNELVAALQQRGMGQILDVVPNHMGVVGNENAWWNDVLENGPASPYAGYFDIDWTPIKPDLFEKVLLPVLGEPYGKVLESQQLQLHRDNGTFTIRYFDHIFPIAPRSYRLVLEFRQEELEAELGSDSTDYQEYLSILTAISHLPPRSETTPEKVAERHREKEVVKRRLAALLERCQALRKFLDDNVSRFNGTPGDPRSFDRLEALLDDQVYRLAFWRVASDEINYRRFFDINDLAALSMEKPEVFEDTHELILRLLREDKLTGVRIDHPDGLYDPKHYLEHLQRRFVLEKAKQVCESDPEFQGVNWDELVAPLSGALEEMARGGRESAWWRPLYVVVEKILGWAEALPSDWPVYGTTGYTFLNKVNGLFIDGKNENAFTMIYQRWIRDTMDFGSLVYRNKFLILQVSMSSELHMLAHQLDRLSEKNRWSRDFTRTMLRHTLREIIASFPVYRSYIVDEVTRRDRAYVEAAVARGKRRNPAISSSLFDYVRDMILLHYPEGADEEGQAEQRRFVGKFQQLTSPVMAKGLEDTTFYVFNRLVSLNEVGGDPDRFGLSSTGLHRYFQERQSSWPYALSTTSTHDTKRSEDVRARLNILAEIPKEWQKSIGRWSRWNKRHRTLLQEEEMLAPDRNDEYLLYQTLVGAWPLDGAPSGPSPEFVERIQAYMLKAIHEAKVYTSWVNPNPAYDEAVTRFVAAILDARISGRFLEDLCHFQRGVSHCGLINSLAQTLLKITAPGVPDIYQGTELWDLSLVDPDNRRPVDYGLRRQLLEELNQRIGSGAPLLDLARELMASKEDGRVKLHVTSRALHCRRADPELFSPGEYHAVEAHGQKRDHLFAFVRRQGERWAIVAVPRLIGLALFASRELPVGKDFWGDTTLPLPTLAPGHKCRNVFTGEVLTLEERSGMGALNAAEVFGSFPVALFASAPDGQ